VPGVAVRTRIDSSSEGTRLLPTTHWSKDFVEHLRTVHFTLIAVSVGLILVLFSSRPYNPATALVEIEGIIELQRVWSPTWLSQYGSTETQRTQHATQQPLNLSLDLLSDRLMLATIKPQKAMSDCPSKVILVFPSAMWYRKGDYSTAMYNADDALSPDDFPKTLMNFRDLWNALHQPLAFEAPKEIDVNGNLMSQVKFESVGSVVLSQLSWSDLGASFERAPVTVVTWDDKSGHQFGLSATLRGKKLSLFFPTTSYDHTTVDQENLVKYFKNWRTGSFDKAFYDLDQATREVGMLKLETLKTLIADEAAKGSQAFEAFGMKFPAGQITLWGIVALLGVQLYLFVYLKQLSDKLRPSDPGWDVPWIGMDQSRLGRIIIFVTMVLLPFAAMIVLGYYEVSHLTHDYWAIADQPCCLAVRVSQWDKSVLGEVLAIISSIAVSIALGALSWRYRPCVVADSAPLQLFE
jgi:hypothetical protein